MCAHKRHETRETATRPPKLGMMQHVRNLYAIRLVLFKVYAMEWVAKEQCEPSVYGYIWIVLHLNLKLPHIILSAAFPPSYFVVVVDGGVVE